MPKEFSIQGGRELDQALKGLPAKLERNILRGAMRAGAAVIRDEARALARASVKTGALRRSIRVTLRTRGGVVYAEVKAGSRAKGGPFYAGFVEFGTARHALGHDRKKVVVINGQPIPAAEIEHPGAARKPFMRPALDGKAQAAIDAVRDYIRRRLGKLTGR